jgi:hypothetical protein
VLLGDERILAIEIYEQPAFSLGLDPALELGAGLGTYVSHALVILTLDSRPFLRSSRSSERGVFLRLHIVDEEEAEFGLDVIFECIDPWLWAGTRHGNGLWESLMVARGNGQRSCWGWVK